jgi:hypothetical protein
MIFTDPDSLPDRLLWLRADRAVSGGSAAHFNGTSHTQLVSQDNRLKTGDVDFGFACWVRVNSRPTVTDLNRGELHVAGKWDQLNFKSSEWLLCLAPPSGGEAHQFRLLASNPSTGSTVYGPRSAIPGGIGLGRWYFVVAWHDSAADTLNLSVDGVPTVAVPYVAGGAGSWAPFHLGKPSWRGGFPVISMARAAFFKQPPGGIGARIGDITATLYNGGEGADLRQMVPDRLADWGLQAYWPLEEKGGTRADAWGGLDLSDPSGVGSTPSPLIQPAGDQQPVSRWADATEGRIFRSVGPAGGVSWKGDFTRLVATASGSRLEHEGLLLSGRPRWTMNLVASSRFDRGFGLYGESSGPSDDDFLEIRVDHDGVPELAVRAPGGPEVVARAADSMAGRRSATAAGLEPLAGTGDGILRVRCRVAVGDGHPFASADRVNVRGLGPPYDGMQILTFATPTEIHYVVDDPVSAAATAGARRFPGGFSASGSPAGHTLDRRLLAPWTGPEWSVSGWVRKADDGRDAAAGGAGIFAAKGCSDARTSPSQPHIVHSGDGTPGSYRLVLPGGPSADFGPATRDVWVHLAAVRSGDSIQLYYDGAPAGSIDVSADPTQGSTFLGLGFGFGPDLAASLPCLLDRWGIWLGRSLSAAEVSALHGGGSGPAFAAMPAGLTAGLSAWYDFDEVSGAGEDASGNGNHLVERGLVPAGEGIAGGIPFSSASTPGLVVGTGRTLIADIGTPSDAGSGSEYLRHVLTVRRDGGVVSFFRNGEPIGSAAIDPGLVGPASGTSRLLSTSDRLPAPHGSIEHVLISAQAMTDEQVAGLGARLSTRTSRTSGVGPLAVLFDATELARVDRMAKQDYHYLWAFTLAGEAALHDTSTAPWRGQAYARSTGFFVSQVFEREGSYDAHLAVVTPPYDRQGRPQPQSCLFVGKVATIDVEPWPESTITYYVSSSHPARDDSNPGTSPDAPLATVVAATSKVNRPNVRVLLKAGEEFPIGTVIDLSSLTGPLLIGSYGDPAAGRPTLIPSTRAAYPAASHSVAIDQTYDVRISGIAVRDTGIGDSTSPEYAKLVFMSGGTRLLLLHDMQILGAHRLLFLRWDDRCVVVDRCGIDGVGDYAIFASIGNAVAVSRCDLDLNPSEHIIRFQNALRTQITHCDRKSGPFIMKLGGAWSTHRYESRYSVVTDNVADLIHTTAPPDHDILGPMWVTIERNFTRDTHSEGDQISVRDNDPVGTSPYWGSLGLLDVPGSSRSGASQNWRCYGNRLEPGKRVNFLSGARALVNEGNENTGATSLSAPPIGLAAAVPDAAVLAASGFGDGPGRRSYRWMRRRAGDGGPFRPLAGQVASTLFDMPEEPGAYEYRLDVINEAGAEAQGLGAVTLVVPTARPEPDYVLIPPSPPVGLAGEPSAPFTVSLREGVGLAGPVSLTPGCDGPGRFDPPVISLSGEAPSAPFYFTPDPGDLGTRLISTTNDGTLLDPRPVGFSVTAIVAPPPDSPTIGIEPPEVLPPVERPAPGLSPRPPRREHSRREVGQRPGSRTQGLAPPSSPKAPDLTGRAAPGAGRQGLSPPPTPGRPGKSLSPRPPGRGS